MLFLLKLCKTLQKEVIVANDSSKHNLTYKQIELKRIKIKSVDKETDKEGEEVFFKEVDKETDKEVEEEVDMEMDKDTDKEAEEVVLKEVDKETDKVLEKRGGLEVNQ